jgi:hypothetical protein
MDLKLLSKNNVGAVSTIFLLILLTQAKFFNFLISTPLGRSILILFILGISYTNTIFGVVLVLFIIIKFNNIDINYIEGFTNSNSDSVTNIKEKYKIEQTKNKTNDKVQGKNNETKGKLESKVNSIEGFNMIERESIMMRGKNSNEIPVFSNTRNQDDVEPSDKSMFSGNFSSL